MNVNNTSSISKQLGTLMATFAMAVGGISVSAEADAFQNALEKEAPAAAAQLRGELHFTNAEALAAKRGELDAFLNGILRKANSNRHPGDLTQSVVQLIAEQLRELERMIDGRIAEATLSNARISPNVWEERRGLAKLRMKAVHITSALRYMAGDIQRFEGRADVEGLHSVAQVSTDRALDRLH